MPLVGLERRPGADGERERWQEGERVPQLRCIHLHQLFRIQYTCFELDAVNIDWWMCIHVCRLCVWDRQIQLFRCSDGDGDRDREILRSGEVAP